MKIPFNIPVITGDELKYISENIQNKNLSGGDGTYSTLCKNKISSLFEKNIKVFMTSSCTDALEASSIILGLKHGDEVIMPSFTFVTTATSFALRGINIKFVDIDRKTLNIDPDKIEEAITKKTKAIVCVHYAGVACNIDKILKIAKDHKLLVIEDAAQSMFSYYKGKHLGGFGDVSTFSYHDTKNIHCGEGGSLIINNEYFFDKSHITIDKGTNRRQFLDGNCEKYMWFDLGSSFVMSDLSAAFLYSQLERGVDITKKRKRLWERYYANLTGNEENFELPYIPEDCDHNAHIFRIRLSDEKRRVTLMQFLKQKGISTTFHFVPLHSSPGGKKFGKFVGGDINTTSESDRILRLPLFDSLSDDQIDYVCENIVRFYNER
jgi:dTDP-4-amino-4,6-dideoxygalactose transaminase